MYEQFQWLFQAIVSQFWLPVSTGRHTTTLFVRRMVLWTLAGLPMSWHFVSQQDGSALARPLLAVLLLPLFTALALAFGGILMAAMLRFGGVVFGTFPGMLGWPGAWMVALADLIWLAEAGSVVAGEQWNASRAGLHREQVKDALHRRGWPLLAGLWVPATERTAGAATRAQIMLGVGILVAVAISWAAMAVVV